MPTYEVSEISRKSSDYPALLNKITNVPDPLYYLGHYTTDLFENTLAVVGSRAVTMYGEWVVENIVKEVARLGITIVSGFMYGVDALAHRAALDAGGKTIAVMAGSVTSVFPKYQEGLFDEIVSNGLVVSEYREKEMEGKWMFARRNRIVAGLSKAVLVVEAGEASGSLITASYAKAYDRRILTVPGNLNSGNSYGTTRLLKEGAKLVTCPADILEIFYNPDNYRVKYSNAVNKRLLEEEEEDFTLTIEDALRLEPLTADELSSRLNLPPTKLLKLITGLTLYGNVSEKDGKYYVS